MLGAKEYTVANPPTYDSGNDKTLVPVEENISSVLNSVVGEVIADLVVTPAAKAMHLSGGKMYYGNVQWPTRYPDVIYSEGSSNYDVAHQNEYSSAGIQLHGPVQELSGPKKVSCAWHLETAVNIYVKDTTENNPSYSHYRRITPSEQGLYTVQGTDYVSNYVFNADRYESEASISDKGIPPGAGLINESQAVVASHVNRPLEVTSNGFALKEDESIRAIFDARLAEEEGLRAYDFYIGTENSIYVGDPTAQEVSVSTMVVTRSFGISKSEFGYPAYTLLPQASAIVDTEGIIRVLQGRQQQRLFPEGAVPWTTVYDIEYHIKWEEIAIATDEGVWFFDWNRKGIFRQYDAFRAMALEYDKPNDELIGWNASNSVWERFDGGGGSLEPSVTTQEIQSGGREIEIIWTKADYDKAGHDNTDETTFAKAWYSVRSNRVLSYSQSPTAIGLDVTTSNNQSAGDTSIDVSTGASSTVSLSEGDYVIFDNHDEAYEVSADVSISSGSSGTITIVNGLQESVPSGTNVLNPYRGIYKIPRQERVRPPFRGTGHQIRLQDFDVLRDIQFRASPRLSYE